jgi:acyl-coenzyme A synthetase/AMP-(fatty) acid ligase
MEYLDWQLERFRQNSSKQALIWHDRPYTYYDLMERYEDWLNRFSASAVQARSSVAVVGDYSPASISCLLALLQLNCIIVPLSRESKDQHSEFFKISEIINLIELDTDDNVRISTMSERRGHPLLAQLRTASNPGLVLFSSGSTGKPKAILHSLPKLLEKFRKPRHTLRTLIFLLFDHIGGFNTLFYTLANLGCLVVIDDHSVAKVCHAIEKHHAELLPTSPSFLSLLLLSRAHETFDLSSLKLITYGTEVMPERTLKMANLALPHAKFLQTYGLSELGILCSKSAADNSLLVKVGGEDYETKVVNGTLHIRTKSSMLGNLNAPSPFDEEGWFDTSDAVIQEGEYYRILGRQSEIINVAGQKVYPAEVEKVIAELPEVIDVTVKGEPHLLLGQIVVATVQMANPIPAIAIKKRIADYSKGRLQPFMVPAKVVAVTASQVNYRFKKIRR